MALVLVSAVALAVAAAVVGGFLTRPFGHVYWAAGTIGAPAVAGLVIARLVGGLAGAIIGAVTFAVWKTTSEKSEQRASGAPPKAVARASKTARATARENGEGRTPRAVGAARSEPSPACPECDGPTAWRGEHGRHYCGSCRLYL